MGFWDNIAGSEITSRNAEGGHILEHSDVLRQTHPDTITPNSPPDWAGTAVRTAPIVSEWRSVSHEEAAAMEARAGQRKAESENWGTYLKALEEIERLDAIDHRKFRNYQGLAAEVELEKLKANSDLAELLHELRPDYAELLMRLGVAEEKADRRIVELRSRYMGMLY